MLCLRKRWMRTYYLGLSLKQPDCWIIFGVVVDWNCFTFLSPKIWEIISINDQYKDVNTKHTKRFLTPQLRQQFYHWLCWDVLLAPEQIQNVQANFNQFWIISGYEVFDTTVGSLNHWLEWHSHLKRAYNLSRLCSCVFWVCFSDDVLFLKIIK